MPGPLRLCNNRRNMRDIDCNCKRDTGVKKIPDKFPDLRNGTRVQTAFHVAEYQ